MADSLHHLFFQLMDIGYREYLDIVVLRYAAEEVSIGLNGFALNGKITEFVCNALRHDLVFVADKLVFRHLYHMDGVI